MTLNSGEIGDPRVWWVFASFPEVFEFLAITSPWSLLFLLQAVVHCHSSSVNNFASRCDAVPRGHSARSSLKAEVLVFEWWSL